MAEETANSGAKTEAVKQNTTVTESPTVEAKQSEVADDFIKGFDEDSNQSSPDSDEAIEVDEEDTNDKDVLKDTPEGESDDESEDKPEEIDSDDTDDTKPQEGKKRDANSRIRELNQKYRQSEAENAELRNQLNQFVEQAVPDFDVQAAIDDGMEAGDARYEALEHRLNRNETVQQLTELNIRLNQEANDVSRDFPFMDAQNNKRTPEDEPLAKRITELWYTAADVQQVTDENGNSFVTQAKVPLYNFVKEMVGIRDDGRRLGAVDGQKSIEKQLSAVDVATGNAPVKKQEEDLFLKGFNSDSY